MTVEQLKKAFCKAIAKEVVSANWDKSDAAEYLTTKELKAIEKDILSDITEEIEEAYYQTSESAKNKMYRLVCEEIENKESI